MLQIEEDLTMRPVNIMIHEMSYVEEDIKTILIDSQKWSSRMQLQTC